MEQLFFDEEKRGDVATDFGDRIIAARMLTEDHGLALSFTAKVVFFLIAGCTDGFAMRFQPFITPSGIMEMVIGPQFKEPKQ